MKILYAICAMISVVMLVKCAEQKTEKIFINFEFNSMSQKKALIQRIKELHFNNLEEIDNSIELEWTITVENEFSKETSQLLFQKEGSYLISPLIDLDYIETDLPNLFSTGKIDRHLDYGTGQLGLYDTIHSAQIFQAIEQMKMEDNDLWLRYYSLPNYMEDGRSAMVLYNAVDQIDFSWYITKVLFAKEDRDEVGIDTEYLQVKMEDAGSQLLHQVTNNSVGHFVAMESNGAILSYLYVNDPITMGTVEMTGDGIFQSMLSAILLKDLPGASIKQLDLIKN